MGGRRRTGLRICLALATALAIGLPLGAARADGGLSPSGIAPDGASAATPAAGDAPALGGPAIFVLLVIWVATLALPRR